MIDICLLNELTTVTTLVTTRKNTLTIGIASNYVQICIIKYIQIYDMHKHTDMHFRFRKMQVSGSKVPRSTMLHYLPPGPKVHPFQSFST